MDQVTIIGNKVLDNLFYTFSYTPLSLQNIHRSWKKIIVCLSSHDFTINKRYFLKSSWIVARTNQESSQNIKQILDTYPTSVVLVSQRTKKFLDKETLLDTYTQRIFCLMQWKKGITNKLYKNWAKINKVYL